MKKFFQSKGFIVTSLAVLCVAIPVSYTHLTLPTNSRV